MVVSRDRTSELFQIYEDLKRQGGGGGAGAGISAAPVKRVSEFHKASRDVTRDLTDTADMLENLSKLTKKNSAFDDHSQEVNQMTIMVKERLQNLHEQINNLGTLKDQTKQWGASQANSHSQTVVNSLKTQLFNTQKFFKDILTTRSQFMKQVSDRRSKFTHSAEREFSSSVFKKARLHEEEEAMMPPGGGGGQLSTHQQQQGDGNVQYYRQREEGVKMLEETIAQLGGLFQDFTRIVAEQEEMVWLT